MDATTPLHVVCPHCGTTNRLAHDALGRAPDCGRCHRALFTGAPVALDELRLSLAQLPAEQREALILVGAGGFAYEEAAEICGCAVGTVKSRVSRARKALHSILEDGSYERDGSAAGDAMSAILADAERLSTAR